MSSVGEVADDPATVRWSYSRGAMRGMPGRRGPWPLGALLLAVGAVLAVPLAGLAYSSETATTVTLTSSENPAAYGDQLILTATVIPASGTAIPSGSVTFEDSGTSLGTVTLGATGRRARRRDGGANRHRHPDQRRLRRRGRDPGWWHGGGRRLLAGRGEPCAHRRLRRGRQLLAVGERCGHGDDQRRLDG